MAQIKMQTPDLSLSGKSMSDEVYNRLEAGILNMQYIPGTVLNECDIAENFNVSRSPVRDALLRLEHAKLIQKSGRARIVAHITPENIGYYYEMWEMSEPYVAGQACQIADTSQICALNDVLSEMKQFAHQDNIIVYRELNFRFHSLLTASCSNPLLSDLHSSILKHIRWGSNYSLSIIEDSKQSNLEHNEIFEAYKQKNQTAVEQLIRKHIKRAANNMKNKYPAN